MGGSRTRLLSAAILAVLSAGASLGAAPHVVSNTSVILLSTISGPTDGELSLVGELHVQATVQPSGGVDVKANLTQSAIGFTVAGSGVLPEVDAIRQRIAEIKAEVVSLDEQLSAAMSELEEIRQVDLFPDLPGLQFNEKRARELRTVVVELQRRIVALQQELDALFERLAQILNDLRDSRPDLLTLYTPIGADSVTAASCTDDLLCDSVLNFALVTLDGEVLPLQLHLTLAFTADGALTAADALACEFVCDSDSGLCSCS